jgi:hypothetical protein
MTFFTFCGYSFLFLWAIFYLLSSEFATSANTFVFSEFVSHYTVHIIFISFAEKLSS